MSYEGSSLTTKLTKPQQKKLERKLAEERLKQAEREIQYKQAMKEIEDEGKKSRKKIEDDTKRDKMLLGIGTSSTLGMLGGLVALKRKQRSDKNKKRGKYKK